MGGFSIADSQTNISTYKNFYQSSGWVAGNCTQSVPSHCIIHVPSCYSSPSLWVAICALGINSAYIAFSFIKGIKNSDATEMYVDKKDSFYRVWDYLLALEKSAGTH